MSAVFRLTEVCAMPFFAWFGILMLGNRKGLPLRNFHVMDENG
jgi:hypothetical protein